VRSLSRSHLLLMSPPLSPLFSYAAPTPHLSPLSLHDALPISLSRGIINALQNTGLGPTIDEGLPIVTGQDAEIASIKLIADGVQHSTIFKDTRDLADQAIVAAESILTGGEPEANDTETYDNGAKVVPSYLLEVQMVLESNYEEILVDSGYYTEEQVEAGQL